MRIWVAGWLVVAACQGVVWGEEQAGCQAEVGEVVSLQRQPAVAGTELGVGFEVVPRENGVEPASPWCNQTACQAGPDGEPLCRPVGGWHCFVYGETCWSERCYIIIQ